MANSFLRKLTMADVATREDVARVSALFTRGAMDAPDLRGDSMVTKHLEKIQQEKEKSAFTKMQALHPTVGPTVCAVALEETVWEADAAHELLTRFEAENQDKLAELLKAGHSEPVNRGRHARLQCTTLCIHVVLFFPV